ncbi:MAG TPA: TonB-dependent receptor [Bryobacteraceae bacterium]|nr:TonB-dependent receptor [Bryobacteraceae bacterium]
MKRMLAIILLMPLLMLTSSAFAQSGMGSISGRVTDATGAIVVGAKVTVRNAATGITTQSISSAEGLYTALQLIPGKYDVEAEAAGFKKELRSGLEVRVADRISLDLVLSVGQQTESITVSAETPLLRTEDAQAGQVIDNSFIMNLPQLNRQSPLNLLALSGNVQGDGTPGGNTRINGGRTSGIEYFMDGIPMSSGRGHSITNLQPNMDSMQEFKVVTNGVSAEYGRISGGYVEIATKSGTNSYHGEAYEYMYNDMFNANSWDQNALGNKKEHFRQNNYGFTLGGPVSIPKVYDGKNRTFFFFDYDILRYKQTGTMIVSSVPTEAERAGDFTNTYGQGLTTMMWDPNGNQVPVLDANGNETGTWTRTTPLGGDGKHVPASMVSPVSAAILNLLPLPNRTSPSGCSSCSNYQAPRDSKTDTNKLGLRIDHLISSNHRFSSRFQLLDSNQGQTRTLGPLSTASTTAMNGGRFVSLNYDWTISPTLLLNVRGGVNHDPIRTGNLLPSDFNSADLGMPAEYQRILGTNNIPNIQIDFGAPGYYGNTASGNINAYTTWQGAATATKILNRHTLKIGFDIHKYYDSFTSMGSGTTTFMVNPVFQTTGDHGFGNAYGAVNTMGSFMLGINDWNTISGSQTRAMAMNYYAGFIQDDFKVTPKLTLNLGLRWDMESPTTERHDKLYFWNPDSKPMFTTNPGWTWEGALTAAGLSPDLPKPSWVTNGYPNGAVCIANTPECKGRSPQTVNPHQFAPRFGMAYQINPKTVLRGSAGLMYLSTTGAAGGFSTANSSLSTGDAADAGWHASNDGQRHYISTWDNPFPQAGSITTYTRDTMTANQQAAKDPGVSVFNRDLHMPREYTWQVSVQREIPWNFVVEGGYSGNRGLGLLAPNSISQFPKALLSPANQSWLSSYIESPNAGQTLATNITGPTQLLGILEYAYPYYGYVNILGSNLGASTFHAFNARLERRFSHGMSFLMNYTLSRNLDNVGGPEANTGGINTQGTGGKTYQSVDSFQETWGLSSIDQTHRLVITYMAELPFGQGKRWLNNTKSSVAMKVLDGAFGGWALNGTYSYHSGTAIQLNASNCQNCTNLIKVETLFGSYATADHNLSNASYSGDRQVLYSPADGRPTSSSIRRIDPTKVTDAQPFTYGNLPTVYDAMRNPSFYQLNMALVKSFRLMKEGRFLQIRAEAENALNTRGYGNYNTKIGDEYFGLITTAGNSPRHIQLSARIVF